MKKEIFCSSCGHKFAPVGREHICPSCKQAAAEATKKAAVLKAKRASWAGKSVPVRISGRASTVIRKYGEANNMTFAESLDTLLKASDFFTSLGVKWEEVEPYKSRCRDKSTDTETKDEPVKPVKHPVKQAAKQASK